ncbi:MAG: hypothetical protein HYX82_00710 [Chloroflexi bacterium]|nr:hypothetical protein [Chloroflexota bacterium]
MVEKGLSSKQYQVGSALEAIEFYYEKGWTDGLPVVPSTAERVEEFLEKAGKRSQDVIGEVPERGRTITAEKVAINAVMAGCLPEYMPVLIAVVEAVTEKAFNLHGSAASTMGSAQLIVVNGPIAKKLGINSGVNLFGPGFRPNATIGRALRLILMNVCGAIPGVMDKSTFGHGGKYSFCIAENEDLSPWEPFHVERGFPREESVVTVFAAQAPIQVTNFIGNTPEDILASVADTMATVGYEQAEIVVIISPEHLHHISGHGWSKRDVKRFLAEKARRSVADWKRVRKMPGAIEHGDEDRMKVVVGDAEDIDVLVGGGGAGPFSICIPLWGGGISSRSVSKLIRMKE